jgi:hypothetical protein
MRFGAKLRTSTYPFATLLRGLGGHLPAWSLPAREAVLDMQPCLRKGSSSGIWPSPWLMQPLAWLAFIAEGCTSMDSFM